MFANSRFYSCFCSCFCFRVQVEPSFDWESAELSDYVDETNEQRRKQRKKQKKSNSKNDHITTVKANKKNVNIKTTTNRTQPSNINYFNMGLNAIPPPPLPPLSSPPVPSNSRLKSKRDYALSQMLLAWYWSGYYAGLEAASRDS